MKRLFLPEYQHTEQSFNDCMHARHKAHCEQDNAAEHLKQLIASPKGMAAIASAGAVNELSSCDKSRTKPILTVLRILTMQWLT